MPSELGIPLSGPMPTATAYATPVIRNERVVYAFDGAANESLLYYGELPVAYDGGGITVTLRVQALSATSGDSVWAVAFERGNTDIDATDQFATAKNVTIATNAVAGVQTVATIDFSSSEIDGLLAGEDFYLKLSRLPTDAADTITTDVQLRGMSLRET